MWNGMGDPLNNKLARLREDLRGRGSLAVAFSGGVDSAFLLKVAHDVLDQRVMAVTARSPSIAARELREAERLACELGVRHLVIDTDEFRLSGYIDNPVDRCYICKREHFTKISAVASEYGLHVVADGSNVDDRGDYRPGARALRELGIVCPLIEAGLKKHEIRRLSKEMGLSVWDKPALACLASRIPYGQKITREKIASIDRAETYLRDLGFRQVRVRHHGDIARIEVAAEDRRRFFETVPLDEVDGELKKCGFSYVALDLRGYRTGSLNEIAVSSSRGPGCSPTATERLPGG
jgi:uncharacterized protein